MGVNTRLLIKSKWEVEDIVEVIMSYLTPTGEPTFKPWDYSPGKGTITFKLKDDTKNAKNLTFYPQHSSPLGACTMLSMGAKYGPGQEESWKILKTIGKVLGGFFNAQDINDTWEEFPGLLCDQDGFTYHFKRAILNNRLSIEERGEDGQYSTLRLDIAGLAKSIKDWETKYVRRDSLLIEEQEEKPCQHED